MPTNLRYGEQGFSDFTALMELVEREENQLEKMGLFSKDYIATTVAEFERTVAGTDDMVAKARGGDRQVAGDDEAFTAYVKAPFFTLDKKITPSEIQDMREWLTAQDPATVQKKVERIIARIQRSHARNIKKSMYACLAGSTYTGGVGATRNFQAMFEVADADMFKGVAGGAVAYDLTDQAKNPAEEFELFRKHIIDTAGDEGDNYKIVMLMGSGAFTRLEAHPDYIEAFAASDAASSVLRERLGGLSNNRVMEWKGVTYIEDISGQIADTKGYMFPLGFDDMFQVKFAPADTMEHLNKTAEEAYLFVEEKRRYYSAESETSLVCVNTRPELVADYTFTIA